MDRLPRRSELPPLRATPFGFTAGEAFFPWQNISEIWRGKAPVTDEASLEFLSGGQRISVCEGRPGFDQLESFMIAAFPTTAAWRQAVPQPAFDSYRMLLYRRT